MTTEIGLPSDWKDPFVVPNPGKNVWGDVTVPTDPMDLNLPDKKAQEEPTKPSETPNCC